MQKTHVIVFTTAFRPFVGGAEIAVENIIERERHRFYFTIITARMDRKNPARENWNGTKIIRVGCGCAFDKIWLMFASAWHAWRSVAETRSKDNSQAQRFIFWAIMASYGGVAALVASKILRVPYKLTLQEGDDLAVLEKRLGVFRVFFKQIFKRANGVQAIAPFLAEWAAQNGTRGRPVVIPNGIDAYKFIINPHDRLAWRREIREELGISENAIVILTVSRLVEKNGIADLLTAVERMQESHCIIIGDGELRGALVRQSKAFARRAHFVGTQALEQIKYYAAASDVFCRPSLSEGQGIVFLEAYAMELPVVGTNVGGIPTVVENNVTGLLVRPNNAGELASALERIASDSSLRSKFINAGRERLRNFSWELLAPKIGDWLESHVDGAKTQ